MIPLSFKEIAGRLKEIKLPETDIVIGIGTGGAVPASLVAFHLGCEFRMLTLNFRDEKNNPVHESPVIISKPEFDGLIGKKILLVDDVSVSGKTMEVALKVLDGFEVKTFALKGRADFVLFPEIKDCVKWPWK